MRSEKAFFTRELDLAEVCATLAERGATSVSLLEAKACTELLEEAERYTYRPASSVVGRGRARVYQRMGVFPGLPPRSQYRVLAASFQRLFDRALARLPVTPFASPPLFNDLMLQRYERGALGISPHRDHVNYRNIICLIVVAGSGRFCICADRAGSGAVEIRGEPGDLIFTRAPGFLGSDLRPFHFVSDIRDTRYVFSLRHELR